MFFDSVATLDELKRLYKQLALRHHPDKGGDVETMQWINGEYEEAFNRLHEAAPEDERWRFDWKRESAFVEVINRVVHLESVQVEVCGQWVWVTGLTYPVRDQLKAAGLWFSRKKTAWYWHPPEQKRRGRGQWSLEKIRSVYGAEPVESELDAALPKTNPPGRA